MAATRQGCAVLQDQLITPEKGLPGATAAYISLEAGGTCNSFTRNKPTKTSLAEIVGKGRAEGQAKHTENHQLLYFLLLSGMCVILQFLPF